MDYAERISHEVECVSMSLLTSVRTNVGCYVDIGADDPGVVSP